MTLWGLRFPCRFQASRLGTKRALALFSTRLPGICLSPFRNQSRRRLLKIPREKLLSHRWLPDHRCRKAWLFRFLRVPFLLPRQGLLLPWKRRLPLLELLLFVKFLLFYDHSSRILGCRWESAFGNKDKS